MRQRGHRNRKTTETFVKEFAKQETEEIEAATTAPQIRNMESHYFINEDIDAGAVKQVKPTIYYALAGTIWRASAQ